MYERIENSVRKKSIIKQIITSQLAFIWASFQMELFSLAHVRLRHLLKQLILEFVYFKPPILNVFLIFETFKSYFHFLVLIFWARRIHRHCEWVDKENMVKAKKREKAKNQNRKFQNNLCRNIINEI